MDKEYVLVERTGIEEVTDNMIYVQTEILTTIDDGKGGGLLGEFKKINNVFESHNNEFILLNNDMRRMKKKLNSEINDIVILHENFAKTTRIFKNSTDIIKDFEDTLFNSLSNYARDFEMEKQILAKSFENEMKSLKSDIQENVSQAVSSIKEDINKKIENIDLNKIERATRNSNIAVRNVEIMTKKAEDKNRLILVLAIPLTVITTVILTTLILHFINPFQ